MVITKSICPECKKIIGAEVYEDAGKTWIEKTCEQHGTFKDVYWAGVNAPVIEQSRTAREVSCANCDEHLSKFVLGNIDVTNKCDLNCDYCFASANDLEEYEPPLKKIKEMLNTLKDAGCAAVQFTGGEPTLRKDIINIVKAAKEVGFTHVQIASNGVKLSREKELAKDLKSAGLNTVYLKFDGTSKETNHLLEEVPDLLENCRKAGLQLTLVPIIIKGWNNQEVGNIVKFAFDNIDIVRGVNFQPVAFIGRKQPNPEERYTIPDLIRDLSNQVACLDNKSFYPIPSVLPISELIEKLGKKNTVKFSTHPACGVATYITSSKGRMACITEIMDVDGFLNAVRDAVSEDDANPFKVVKALMKAKNALPNDLDITRMLKEIFLSRNYSALGEFHSKMILIGAMHFQDSYNLDLERLKRCVICYVTPDEKLIPFCEYNNLGYRERMGKEWKSEKK